MKKSTAKRPYGRRPILTTEELDRKYCLHYQGKGKPCPLDTCCRAEEKREALKRELPPPFISFA